MNFIEYLQETNLQDLYQNTVQAFPKTRKRQHSIDTIHIMEMQLTPYLGVKTLFVKGLARNTENGNEYNPIVLFKNVKYHSEKNQNWIEAIAKDGQKFFFEKLSKNDVVIRCNCNDFHWRFNYTDHLDKSLYGRLRKKYEAIHSPGSSNPLELSGMCKHVIKLVKSLHHSNILED
jgi:hypothetical protein